MEVPSRIQAVISDRARTIPGRDRKIGTDEASGRIIHAMPELHPLERSSRVGGRGMGADLTVNF